jgi:SAM-dependent methyltransferase
MTEIYQKNWMKLWTSEGYQLEKRTNFKKLDAYLKTSTQRILDIGCGLAWESRLFNQKYGTELWLLDGDASANAAKLDTFGPEKANHGKWHNEVDSLYFYHPMKFLDQQLKTAGITNYHFVDVNNINIPEDIKFDVITSWLSCGFHYTALTYRDLILKHSHADTVVALDMRIPKRMDYPPLESGMEIVSIINQGRKHANAHVRFV